MRQNRKSFLDFLCQGLGLERMWQGPWPMSSSPGGEGRQGASCHRAWVRAWSSQEGSLFRLDSQQCSCCCFGIKNKRLHLIKSASPPWESLLV